MTAPRNSRVVVGFGDEFCPLDDGWRGPGPRFNHGRLTQMFDDAKAGEIGHVVTASTPIISISVQPGVRWCLDSGMKISPVQWDVFSVNSLVLAVSARPDANL